MRTFNFFFGFVFLILGGLAFLPGAAAAAIVAGSAGMMMLTSVENVPAKVTVFRDRAGNDKGENVRVVELEDAAGIVVFAMKDGKLTSRFFRTQPRRSVLS